MICDHFFHSIYLEIHPLFAECQHLKDPREYYIQQLERYISNPDLNVLLGDLSKVKEQDRTEASRHSDQVRQNSSERR